MQLRKIFITGHTSGIGKAIYQYLEEEGHYVDGGSRLNGYDITKPNTVQHIIRNYDVLINNTYAKGAQFDLLKDVYNGWKNRKKTIINIGSWQSHELSGRPLSSLNYSAVKKSLETYSRWISMNDKECRSMIYNVGFVDTPLAREHMKDWPKDKQKFALERAMDPYEIGVAIEFMIENKHNFREVTHHG